MCHEPDNGAADCVQCGWPMRRGHLFGGADPQANAEFEQKFSAARLGWEQRALLVAGFAPDTLPPELAAFLGPARPTQPVPAARAADGIRGADLDEVLRRLVDGATRRLNVVECLPDRLTLTVAGLDANGVPVAGEPAAWAWPDVVPELATDPQVRRFQLAGGLGGAAVDRAAFAAAVSDRLGPLLAPDGADLVLVTAVGPWSLLERAVAVLAGTHEHAAVVRTADEGAAGVAALLRRAPLAYDYELLVAADDPATGRPMLMTFPVFPAGTQVPAGAAASTTLELLGPPGATSVVLPMYARRGPDAAHWPVLSVTRTALPTRGEQLRVTFRLDGPGVLTAERADGAEVAPAGTVDPGTVLAAHPAATPLDLLCLVELCGRPGTAAVEGRLRLVAELLNRVGRRPGTRSGLIGYYDHVDRLARMNPEYELLEVAELGDTDRTLNRLARWRPREPQRDLASALEEALAEAGRMLRQDVVGGAQRDGGQRTVLVVAGRPPSEPTGLSPLRMPVCPHGVDWRYQVRRLRRRNVRVIAVLDGQPLLPPGDPMAETLEYYLDLLWEELAPDGRYLRELASAVQLDLAVRHPTHQHGAIPLAYAAVSAGQPGGAGGDHQ